MWSRAARAKSLAVHWNIDPVLIDLGLIELRWYGLFFATGVMLGARAMPHYFERFKLPPKHAGAMTIWAMVSMVLGAHFLHLLFYEPRSFIDNPRRIIEIGKGLASHGGGLGAVLAVFLYSRSKKIPFHRLLDPMVGTSLWVIPFVRLGNFFNSEIYGRATDLPWAVIFARRGFTESRHPSQLYEMLVGFALLGLWLLLGRRARERWAPGALSYLTIFCYFTTRFLIEFVKEYQTLHASFPLTMGQMLSTPLALLGLGMFLFSPLGMRGQPNLTPIEDESERSARSA
ncbi:MAG: prolipoprotein diacylglyceryl transferase, partial [Deltaproteobacteria bacterium]|nr:prolipoprotein diacylglyceryl transferase [Deltaproteobacteria bacterium]